MRFKAFRSNVLSDERLLEQFQVSGNIDALGILFKRYMHLVYGVCLKYLKSRDDAQDAVMEIFEKLEQELRIKKVDAFKPWLYVVTKNHCLMELRSRQAKMKKEKDYGKSELLFMESSEDMHLNNEPWEPDALDKRLKECLEKLKEQQRACVELFYFKEMSYSEICDNLSLDIKKVKSYIQNGKRNLKNCIEFNA